MEQHPAEPVSANVGGTRVVLECVLPQWEARYTSERCVVFQRRVPAAAPDVELESGRVRADGLLGRTLIRRARGAVDGRTGVSRSRSAGLALEYEHRAEPTQPGAGPPPHQHVVPRKDAVL